MSQQTPNVILAQDGEAFTKQEIKITILTSFLQDQLEIFEAKFESNEDEFNYEQMKSYCEAAMYLHKMNGRAGLIRRVLQKMNELKF